MEACRTSYETGFRVSFLSSTKKGILINQSIIVVLFTQTKTFSCEIILPCFTGYTSCFTVVTRVTLYCRVFDSFIPFTERNVVLLMNFIIPTTENLVLLMVSIVFHVLSAENLERARIYIECITYVCVSIYTYHIYINIILGWNNIYVCIY